MLYILFAACLYFVCRVRYILFVVSIVFCLQGALYFICSEHYILFVYILLQRVNVLFVRRFKLDKGCSKLTLVRCEFALIAAFRFVDSVVPSGPPYYSYLFNFLERDMYNATLESHFESIIYNRAMKPQIY